MKSILIVEEKRFKDKSYGPSVSELANDGWDMKIVREKEKPMAETIEKNIEGQGIVLVAGTNRALSEAVNVLEEMKGHKPNLAVFIKGRGHIFGKRLGLKSVVETVKAIKAQKETEVVLSEAGDGKKKGRFFFSDFKAGFPADIRKEGIANKLKVLFGKRERLIVTVDGTTFSTKAVVIINGRYDTGETRLNRGLDWTSRGFRILLLEKTKLGMLWVHAVNGFSKLSEKQKGVQVKHGSEVTVSLPENSEETGCFEIDGILHPSLPVRVSLTDKKIILVA